MIMIYNAQLKLNAKAVISIAVSIAFICNLLSEQNMLSIA